MKSCAAVTACGRNGWNEGMKDTRTWGRPMFRCSPVSFSIRYGKKAWSILDGRGFIGVSLVASDGCRGVGGPLEVTLGKVPSVGASHNSVHPLVFLEVRI